MKYKTFNKLLIVKNLILFLFFVVNPLQSQQKFKDCIIRLDNNILSIENSKIKQTFEWNNGQIIHKSIENKESNATYNLENTAPDFFFLKENDVDGIIHFKSTKIQNHHILQDHLQAQFVIPFKGFEIKKVYRIYPEVACLGVDYYLKINNGNSIDTAKNDIFSDQYTFPGKHWKLDVIKFLDVTDKNNNLVDKNSYLSFVTPLNLQGNLLVIKDLLSNEQFYFLKEAPLCESQVNYPGYDFQVKEGQIKIHALGELYQDINEGEWVKCYGYAFGIGGKTELELLTSLRSYQKNIKKYNAERDEMIMMNTWGDRGQDGKLREDFAIREIQAGKKLGITHFQLDDGWQQGLSKNSKFKSGELWDLWSKEDWLPHSERFPNGLEPVIKKANEENIEIGVWFHPSNANSYEYWEQDADILLGLNRKYGIKTIKIDGVKLYDKSSDVNLRKIFEKVTQSTKGEVVFNLDATADVRGGYFYLNEYGNIFLENRYTDWGKYYPHWTLRNLWQLSKYVQPEKLQIEFLNIWRNKDKYWERDPLAPQNVSFEYVFATTIMAQPLAWFEGSNLPEEAFKISPVVSEYQEIMAEIHKGIILPIGQEPNGTSWTGFQSIIDENSGFIIVYREFNESATEKVKTYIPDGKHVTFEQIIGSGENFEAKSSEHGKIKFSLPKKFSYCLYKYSY